MKTVIIHIVMGASPDNNMYLGYARSKKDAHKMYREYDNHLILDYSSYNIFSPDDKTLFMLHCNLAKDELTEDDKQDLLGLVSFAILQTVLYENHLFEDRNANIDGLPIIVA